jgi:hypothetical protein
MTQVLRRVEELDRSKRVRQVARLIVEETLEAGSQRGVRARLLRSAQG